MGLELGPQDHILEPAPCEKRTPFLTGERWDVTLVGMAPGEQKRDAVVTTWRTAVSQALCSVGTWQL